MSARRFLKYINSAIALAAIALLAAVYWFGYRPLPQTSGTLRAPVAQAATIARDALGVPHIRARSIEDALFLQGFAMAQDRLWQMDGLRRLASGELSEVVGAAGLESDREAREMRLRRIAEEQYPRMSTADRALMAAFARGVNFYIETQAGNLPVEFTLLGYDPRPWSVVDTMAIGLHMFRTLTSTWKDEIRKRSMLLGENADRQKVEYLWPPQSGNEPQPGSNAWAIAGSRTATGKPLLANDPHLEFSNPATWYMAHMQAPGLDVTGVTLPGVPGIIIGHNDRIAWGVTNLGYDVMDLYVEKIDSRTGQYQFRGQVEQARPEHETIPVKGQAAVELNKWITRHGPVFLEEGDQRLALRWIASDPSGFQFPFLDIDRARDWNEFRAALRRYPGPGQNFVYADVDGNIGYQAAGSLPIRKNYTGDVPVDGSSGESEWDGFIPFDELPSAYNPPSGVIVTANQNPFAPHHPDHLNGQFAPYYRPKQIRDLLLSRKDWRAAGMLGVQKDIYSGFSKFLADSVVAAYQSRGIRNPALAEGVEMLRNWNGQMQQGRAAPFLASLVYQHLRKAIAERAAPGKAVSYEAHQSTAVIERLLRERPAGWFDDWNTVLLRSLADALDEGRRMQGRNPGKWDYGRYLEVRIPHPVGQRLPLIGPYFVIGPLPMSGSSTAVKQTTRRLGPSMRFVADLSDWEQSLQNVTIGESGQLLSSHFKDQWDAYYTGRGLPMQYRRVEARSTLEVTPR